MATGEGAVAGAAIGSIIPGIGNILGGAIGGLVGLGIDILNYIGGSGAQAAAAAAAAAYATATMQTQLTQATENASALTNFLSHMPTPGQELTTSTGDPEFDAQYRALLAQFGNINVLAGATGRVGAGTSMQAVAAGAQQQVTDLVTTSTEEANRQLAIYQTTITTVGDALAAAQAAEYARTHSGLFGHGGFLGLGI